MEIKANICPNLHEHVQDGKWLLEHAILTPLNDNVNQVNLSIIQEFHGRFITYRSVDSTLSEGEAVHFPMEFLNSIELSGLLPRKLTTRRDLQLFC